MKEIEPDLYAVESAGRSRPSATRKGAEGKDLFDKFDELDPKDRIRGMLAKVVRAIDA